MDHETLETLKPGDAVRFTLDRWRGDQAVREGTIEYVYPSGRVLIEGYEPTILLGQIIAKVGV